MSVLKPFLGTTHPGWASRTSALPCFFPFNRKCLLFYVSVTSNGSQECSLVPMIKPNTRPLHKCQLSFKKHENQLCPSPTAHLRLSTVSYKSLTTCASRSGTDDPFRTYNCIKSFCCKATQWQPWRETQSRNPSQRCCQGLCTLNSPVRKATGTEVHWMWPDAEGGAGVGITPQRGFEPVCHHTSWRWIEVTSAARENQVCTNLTHAHLLLLQQQGAARTGLPSG